MLECVECDLCMFQLNVPSFHTVNWGFQMFDPLIVLVFDEHMSFKCSVCWLSDGLLVMQTLLVLLFKTGTFLPSPFHPDIKRSSIPCKFSYLLFKFIIIQ